MMVTNKQARLFNIIYQYYNVWKTVSKADPVVRKFCNRTAFPWTLFLVSWKFFNLFNDYWEMISHLMHIIVNFLGFKIMNVLALEIMLFYQYVN